MSYFTIERLSHKWGDYFDILAHGMASYRADLSLAMEVQRSGPFIPPLTMPGLLGLIVTEEFRQYLIMQNLKGISFRNADKKKIVEIDWLIWDDIDEPEEYPEGGEPEGYIMDSPHSEKTSAEIGQLWELVAPVDAKVYRACDGICTRNDIFLIESSCGGADIFRADGVGYLYATKKAVDLLLPFVDGYISFVAAKTK